MTALILILGLLALCFAAVLIRGAPYLPTLSPQVDAALELAELSEGDTLLELGCGDGRVLIAAAKKGINAVGYELNPLLAIICYIRTWRYRKNIKIIWGDFWQKPWPEAQAIFTFLLPKYMEKLNNKVVRYKHKPIKVVSFAFQIESKPISKQKSGVFRYDFK